VSGQDPNAEKNSMNLLWIVAGIFIVSLIVWYFLGYWLKLAFIQWRLFQTQLLTFFGADLEHLEYILSQISPNDLNADLALYISDELAWWLVVPAFALMAIMSLILWKGHVVMRFRKTYSMTTLAEQEVATWPVIAPVLKLDLIKQDIHKGPWSMAMNPVHFGRRYKLLNIERMPDKSAAWREGTDFLATVKKDMAYRVFCAQMGQLWEGPARLPKYTRALFAIFAARMNHDSKPARDLINQLALTAAKGEIDYTGMTSLLKKHYNARAVQKVIKSHAYIYTVMATMILLARTDGVQATSDFIWLKPIDRKLWFMLNCVGRQVVFCEVAGPFAHWIAEKQLGRPLYVPKVEQAIIAYEKSMARTIYVPTEEELQVLEGEREQTDDEKESPSTEDLLLGED
jgi:intracellular multiplication protein IcmP